LLYGDILAADIEEGRSLLQEAADHGDIAAMYTLGKAYADGVVLTKNTTKARQLLSRVDSDNARLLLNSL
jgi:TPR repeat protein